MHVLKAIENHDVKLLSKLLAAGEDPDGSHADTPSWVPLKQAIEEICNGGPIEAVAILLSWGANVDGGKEPGNSTPLIVAAMNRQFEAALLLLAAGADPNVRDTEGDTPLSLSINNRDDQLESILRLCGAE